MKRIAVFLGTLLAGLRLPAPQSFAAAHTDFIRRAKRAEKRHIRKHGGYYIRSCPLCVSLSLVTSFSDIDEKHIMAVQNELDRAEAGKFRERAA